MHEDHAYFFTCPSTRQNPVLDYPLIKLINSTATVPRTRQQTTKRASPIADSAAATVKLKRAKTCPRTSSKATEKKKKI